MRTFTTMGRPLDPRYRTNVAIGVISLLVMLAGGVYRLAGGSAWLSAGWWGFTLGVGTFLGWAIGREIDPDHPYSAFVAAGLALGGALLWGLPALLANFWILYATRMLSRTTGLPPTIFDSLLLLGVAAWLSWNGNWAYLLITAAVLCLDGRLRAGEPRQYYLSALALVLAGVATVFRGALPAFESLTPGAILALLVFSLASLPALLGKRTLASRADYTAETLDVRRVMWSGWLVLLVGFVGVVWRGFGGLVAFIPAWSALVGASIWRLADRFR